MNIATDLLNNEMLMTGVNSIAPVVMDRWLNETNSGRAVRDRGDFIKGVEQDFKETTEGIKKNAETFTEDWKNNKLYQAIVGLGANNIRFWTSFWGRQQEAEEWNRGDHESIEDLTNFVNNGGELTVQPETAVIEPDENWVFPEDASIEDIMNWMNTRNGAKLLDSGVSAGVYATPGGTGTGEQITSQDIAAFNKVPDQMSSAVAKAVGGIRVQMDRTTVGYLVAPIVSNIIASQVG